jgi:tetratricopeptide (TPR) repeat protein
LGPTVVALAIVWLGLAAPAGVSRADSPIAAMLGMKTTADGESKPNRPGNVGPGQRPTSTRGNEPPIVAPDEAISVHLDLARVYESQGQVEAAINEYQKAVDAAAPARRRSGSARPSAEMQALAHRRMGAALDRIGQYAVAESHYKQALELSPRDPRVWNDAGYSCYLQRKFGEAEMRFRTATRLDLADPRYSTNLGLCLAATGRDDQALEALTRAAGPAVGHANLAYLLAATGRVDDARTHYRKALELQPNFEVARTALARLDVPGTTPPPESRNPVVATGATKDPSLTRTSLDPASAPKPAEPRRTGLFRRLSR